MNRKLALSFMMLLVLVVGGACQSLNQVTPAGLDNAAIEVEVRAKMAEDIELKSFGLSVAVDNGVVTLGGNVENNDQRVKAGQAARDVKGIKSVINNITIKK